MGTYRLKRKLFATTKYDSTDEIKRMKDSDILAEEEKKKPGYGKVISRAASGAAKGLAVGATIGLGLTGMGGVSGGLNAVKNTPVTGKAKTLKRIPVLLRGTGSGLKKNSPYLRNGLKYGAIIGATAAGYKAHKERKQEEENTEFYNNRLREAQRQAERREKKDWKINTTQRDGYSF